MGPDLQQRVGEQDLKLEVLFVKTLGFLQVPDCFSVPAVKTAAGK